MPIAKVPEDIAQLVRTLNDQDKNPHEIARLVNLKPVQVLAILASDTLKSADLEKLEEREFLDLNAAPDMQAVVEEEAPQVLEKEEETPPEDRTYVGDDSEYSDPIKLGANKGACGSQSAPDDDRRKRIGKDLCGATLGCRTRATRDTVDSFSTTDRVSKCNTWRSRSRSSQAYKNIRSAKRGSRSTRSKFLRMTFMDRRTSQLVCRMSSMRRIVVEIFFCLR